MEVTNVPSTIYAAVIFVISTCESNLFDALGQWGRSKKQGLGEKKKRFSPFSLPNPLVAHPHFRSSTLTESLG